MHRGGATETDRNIAVERFRVPSSPDVDV